MLLLLLLLLSSLVALRSGQADAGRLDQADGVVTEAGQTQARGSQPVVRSGSRLSRLTRLKIFQLRRRKYLGSSETHLGSSGGRAGLVAVLGQQVGGRGAVLRGAVGLAGVTRLLAGQGEALRGAGVDQLVVAVVAEHHLLQPSGAHRVVLEAPRAGLDVAGRGHGVVVMLRRLAATGRATGTHQLLSRRIAGARGLVMVVANLVEAVGVGRGGAGGCLDGTTVHGEREVLGGCRLWGLQLSGYQLLHSHGISQCQARKVGKLLLF